MPNYVAKRIYLDKIRGYILLSTSCEVLQEFRVSIHFPFCPHQLEVFICNINFYILANIEVKFRSFNMVMSHFAPLSNLDGRWDNHNHIWCFKPTDYKAASNWFIFPGIMTGVSDHFSYLLERNVCEEPGFTLYEGTRPALEHAGRYSTELYTQRAVDIINNQNISEVKPL